MSDAEARLRKLPSTVICYGIEDYGPVPEDIQEDVAAVLTELEAERAKTLVLREALVRFRDTAELTNTHGNHQALAVLNFALAQAEGKSNG